MGITNDSPDAPVHAVIIPCELAKRIYEASAGRQTILLFHGFIRLG